MLPIAAVAQTIQTKATMVAWLVVKTGGGDMLVRSALMARRPCRIGRGSRVHGCWLYHKLNTRCQLAKDARYIAA